jgi:outer membrane lipopolysaccharide assembly protein LptE/RlpB
MTHARLAAALLLVAASAFATGCGYSATAGSSRLPPGAERVFVPSFANQTADAEAGALVASALREELARRGTAGGEGAAARIEGAVTRASATPVTTQGGTWRLTFEVQARLVVEGKEAAAATVRREVDYLGEVDAIATEGRRRLAVRKAASDAARDIVERFEAP